MRRLVLAGLALTATPLAAQGASALLQAQAQGVIGERYDGYLGYVRQPDSNAARVQAEAVNIRRRALYTRFGTEHRISPQDVGITAACTTLSRVEVGEAYMLADGVWRIRSAGQPAPVPAYCTGG
ncbi:YdbL family protein [Sphingomonas sp. KRR8]|uniref:YdbL family protein n=1 Tax=Sphingomonas sp. KRR8 TaxID=2942996 RepID=UPI0020217EFD|nr:DUF1318 domain-containing protein [Sphingomonas sp. KRR8]URD61226.1 YdbL family protein [Sphingomonas sp. KRR8]